MAHGLPRRAVRVCIESRIKLQVSQCHHAADPEFLLRLLDGVKSETGEVDRRTDLTAMPLPGFPHVYIP